MDACTFCGWRVAATSDHYVLDGKYILCLRCLRRPTPAMVEVIEAPDEVWLPVVGYEGLYEVSDYGRIRSFLRPKHPDRMIKPTRDGRYLVVNLTAEGGRQATRRVHRIVADAFLGPQPDGLETLHGPGGSLDNRLANLSYGTTAQNSRDRERDGSLHHGSGSPLAKLTEGIVADCRGRYAAGASRKELAAEYGVTPQTIGHLVRGSTWKSAPGMLSEATLAASLERDRSNQWT